MPGICGLVNVPGGVGRMPLDAMLRTMLHAACYTVEGWAPAGSSAAMGRVSLGFVNVADQPSLNAARTMACVMDGELYEAPDRCADHAQILLAGIRDQGRKFLNNVEGKFAAAIWNEEQQRLILTNDRFGMKPLYYCHCRGKLLFASEIKALLTDPDVSRSPSQRGLAEFFTFGHMLGETTLLESVRVLPPAAWLVYDARTDELTVDRYWRLADECGKLAPTEESVDRLCEALKTAVDRQTRDTEHLGISLSGGLDGRTILAALDMKQTPLKSVCMGMEGSLDHRSAARLAKLADIEHHQHVLDAGFLGHFEQHLQRMVHLTDGQYLDQCIVLPTLPLYRELGIRVLLRGHAGELMHLDKAYNFSLDAEALALKDELGLRRWLLRRMCSYMLDGVEGSLFAGLTAGETQGMAAESLRNAVNESAGMELLARVSHLFVAHRLRRETAMSLAMFNSVVETRVPLLDHQVVSALFRMPASMKLGDRLQREFIRRNRPEFLQVINSNTGAPMGAGALSRKLATLRMKLLAKLGVPGYQPYERLGLWLRRELRPLVQNVLLGETCLQRGVFEPDTVRRVVQQHVSGTSNHTYLLMAMMIFELGQQEFIDGEPFDAPACDPAAICYSEN